MNKQGFTLIEVLVAIVIVGIALVSLIAANSSFTSANGYGIELSTSEFLIEQIREMTTLAEYSNLYGFNGADYNPPKKANGEPLEGFGAFHQIITVEKVNASDFQEVEVVTASVLQMGTADGSIPFIKVTVTILLNSKPVNSASWIRAAY